MNRRRFLKFAAGSSPIIAGCTSLVREETTTESPTDVHTTTSTFKSSPRSTGSPTQTEESNPTTRDNPDTVFVGPNGDDANPGTRDAPLRQLQTALDGVKPGETIHALRGEYETRIVTRRSGKPDAPITITGPPNAIFRPPQSQNGLIINHGHVHLRGLTFDGLLDRNNPEDPNSYAQGFVKINEALPRAIEEGDRSQAPVAESEYLEDIVIKPHAMGNSTADFIKVNYAKNVEIGEFAIIGLAGAKYLKGDAIGHNSEFVYLGNPRSAPRPPDQSSYIHVHHIDNSAGHPHAELVDCKSGTSNILIEYCTDTGGSTEAITDDEPGVLKPGAIHIGGTDVTVRWNILNNGAHSAINIESDPAAQQKTPTDVYGDGGSNNAIYYNQLLDNKGYAIAMIHRNRGQGQADQRVICGNEYNGETHGDPDNPCSEDIPKTDMIGHLGGESPWT